MDNKTFPALASLFTLELGRRLIDIRVLDVRGLDVRGWTLGVWTFGVEPRTSVFRRSGFGVRGSYQYQKL